MELSDYKNISIGGVQLKRLEINGILVWKRRTNQVPASIDSGGSIYNGGLGYKNGYRVRSGGAEAAQTHGVCTGYIPVNPGDVVRWSGWDYGAKTTTSNLHSSNALNVANDAFENLGQFTNQPAHYGIFATGATYNSYGFASVDEESDGVFRWTVPPAASGVAYIRVSGYQYGGLDGADLIVTVNEEIR